MKETPRITVTSSLNEISMDQIQLGNSGGKGVEAFPFLQQAYGQIFILHDRMVNKNVFSVMYLRVSFLRRRNVAKICLCRT
jgi:hypothetical protein